MSKKGDRIRGYCAKWGMSEASVRKHEAMGAPFEDDAAMVRWFYAKPDHSQASFGDVFVRKIEELRDGVDLSEPGAAPVVDNRDFAEFEAAFPEAPPGAGDTAALAKLKRFRDFALFRIGVAQKRNDTGAIKDATRQLTHFSSVIHDEELRAFRLGRELGDILQRGEVEAYVHALTYWQMRCVDDYVAAVVQALIAAAAAKPLDRDAVVAIIEGPLLDARIVKPIERALATTAKTALPVWFLDAIRESMNRVIEPCPADSQP